MDIRRWGIHRVVPPAGSAVRSTPQACYTLDARPTLLCDTELLVEVQMLNLDATSSVQLERKAQHTGTSMAQLIMDIIKSRGKMHNPDTDSGGVRVGVVTQCGPKRVPQLLPGTRVIPLCSLTAIPLHLELIERIRGHQVWVKGFASIYESMVVAPVPTDSNMSIEAILAAIDVSRMVPLTIRAVQQTLAARPQNRLPNDDSDHDDDPYTVTVIGCGRSGLLALTLCAELAPKALLIGLDVSDSNLEAARSLLLPRLRAVRCDATDPINMLESVRRYQPHGADLVLNLVSVPNTEAGSSLICRQGGQIVYFSMATSFARATLSTDVTGNPMTVVVGAGVFSDAATLTLDFLERHPRLATLFSPPPIVVFPAQKDSAMHRFASFVGLTGALYAELHRWSVQHSTQFWDLFLTFCNIVPSPRHTSVLERHGPLFFHADWFPGAGVNHAQVLMRHCLTQPEHIALVSRGEGGTTQRMTLTYGQIYDAVAELQVALQSMGIVKGSVVAAIMPNVTASMIAMLAATSLGACWTCLSLDLGSQVILSRFRQVTPTVLFVCTRYQYSGKILDKTEMLKEVAEALKGTLRGVVCAPNETLANPGPSAAYPSSWIAWESLFNEKADQSMRREIIFEPVSFSDPLYILYTSGTTGLPKCVVQGFGATLNHLKETMLHLDLGASDRAFIHTSLSWMLWHWGASLLALGMTIILFDGSPFFPEPTSLWTDIAVPEKITYWGTSARYLETIRKANYVPPANDLTLRIMSSTGSPLGAATAEFFAKALPRTKLTSISGGTELNGCLAICNPMAPQYGLGEIQGPPLGMDVDVVDAQGDALRCKEGELVVRAPFPSQPLYFHNDPRAERYFHSYFRGASPLWWHGDYAVRTLSGGFFILGRSDATLNPGGVRIGTLDYYAVLDHIVGVQDSVVVGIPSKTNPSDEEVVLFIVVASGCSFDGELVERIKSSIKSKLSAKHVPKYVEAVTAIPLNLNLKKMELLVRDLVKGKVNSSATPLTNPESLQQYIDWGRMKRAKM